MLAKLNSRLDSRWIYAACLYPLLASIPYLIFTDRYDSPSRVLYLVLCAFFTGLILWVGISRRCVSLRARVGTYVIWIVAGLSLVYAAVCLYLAYGIRLLNGLGIVSDVALVEQMLWAGSQGHLFYSSFNNGSYLSGHFAPYLLVLTAIFALIPNIGIVFGLQTASLAAAGIVLFRLAERSYAKFPAFLLALAFWASPAILSQHLTLYNNHFAPLFWFAACYAFAVRKFFWFCAASVLAASVQEDIAFSLLVFALLAVLEKRSRLWKGWTIGFPLIWLAVAFLVIQTNAQNTGIALGGNFADLGSTPQQIGGALIQNPALIVQKMSVNFDAKLLWAYELTSPFLFVVPFFHPLALAALPDWLVFMFIPRPPDQYSAGYYNSLFISAVLFSAFALVVQRLTSPAVSPARTRLAKLLAVLVLGTNIAALPLVVTPEMFTTVNPARLETLNKIRSRLGANDCVTVSHDIAQPFAQRTQLFVIGLAAPQTIARCENLVVSEVILGNEENAQNIGTWLKTPTTFHQVLRENGIVFYSSR